MNCDEVLKLKKSLNKAINEGKTFAILDIMKQFNDDLVATKELLKKTDIGVFIGKQRSHPNADIAKLAKDIVKKWKTAVQSDKPSPSLKPNSVADEGFAKPRPVNKNPTIKRENSQGEISSPGSIKRENDSSSSSPSTPKTENDRNIAGDRSFKKDNVKHSTGDSKRDKCIELLYDSLAFDSNNDSDIILDRAIKIEKIVLEQFDGEPEKQYRDKLRGMISNLKDKKNPGLRNGVISGEITVQKFCIMSKEDMASEEKKARNREIQQLNLFKARGAGPTQAETNMFRCGKCGQRKTTYFQMQTRSADEPMTTFVTCTVCNNRWKFC
ncbi:transcription factor S-II, central domain-containing protein [Glomus cerebriforme]|uniref:Transcription elongation factor n=1 Tax=Glomus cerebriforme TaxID=658196 RepID=A0A397T0V9_9GLOM|nr:transcription factor S-II, central domain-containing protein [Glomus cerebriforme]